MTELFLDDMPAALMPSASFKLTDENYYFTKSSSYTFDVELPLGVEQNRRIFGNIGRLDVSKEVRVFRARLVVDNETLLVGTAKLTSVSESSVKVQLLGKEAAYNYGNKAGNLYIDQMDLGDWYHETWPDGSYYGYEAPRRPETKGWHYSVDEIRMFIYERVMYKGPEFGEEKYTGDALFERFLGGNLGWVTYPTYGENSEVRFNQVAYDRTNHDSDKLEFYPFIKHYEGVHTQTIYMSDYLTRAFAIQPMLWKVAEIIAKYTGFTLAREYNALYTDDLFKRIFLVNCSTSLECCKCLPHWSVNEFWEQLENTFGLVMSVDYISGTMRLLRRKDFYTSATQVQLRDIEDAFDTALEDETKHDISVSSVGFADSDYNPEDLLDEEVLANVDYMDFDTIADMVKWGKGTNSGSMHLYKNYIFRCADGRQFIYSTNAGGEGYEGFIEVNMLRPRIPKSVTDELETDKEDSPDIDIELKIVPAKYSIQKADILDLRVTGGGPGIIGGLQDEPIATFDVRMLQIPGPETPSMYGSTVRNQQTDEVAIDLQAIVEDQEDYEFTKESTSDLLYAAIINPANRDSYSVNLELPTGGSSQGSTTPQSVTFEYPRAILRERASFDFAGVLTEYEDSPYSLSLIPIDGQRNLANATIKDLTVIHTDVRHCFKFIADKVPDTGAIFNIRNRLFVCEKIEVNIKPDGLDHLMTGYFYELKN